MIIGASGHGKVCAEIAVKTGYKDILFLDDNKNITSCAGHRIVGSTGDFVNYVNDFTEFFVGIGNAKNRQRIMREVEAVGGQFATLIHPNSIIGEDVKIGEGSVIMAGAVINSGTVIGKGVIINTSSSVDHDCNLEDYVHIAVGAHVAGTVNIGLCTWIGAGSIISNNLTICNDCILGAGTVVVKDINDVGTYMGIPAKKKSCL